jgi:hypothetical protein
MQVVVFGYHSFFEEDDEEQSQSQDSIVRWSVVLHDSFSTSDFDVYSYCIPLRLRVYQQNAPKGSRFLASPLQKF